MHKHLHAIVPILCAAALGCSADDGTKTSGSSNNAGSDPVVLNEGQCPTDNLTTTCTCTSAMGNIPGRQTCFGGVWRACECDEPIGSAGAGAGGDAGTPPVGVAGDPPGNRSAERFDWQRTPFELGSCKPGRYVGYFEGFYGSPIIFGAPFPVVATDTPAGPGLEFTLEKLPGSGELFAIKGGKMRGNATGVADFTADLTGTLDCSTKKYVGTIDNGEYIVLANPMATYHFIGDMLADYDKIQNAFVGGKWRCTEPPTTTIPPGGDGIWNAKWQPM